MEVDEFVVYKAWSVEQVQDALDDFRRVMYDGGGIDELRAGIHCFDFITRRSDLPEKLVFMIQCSIDQAHMRIELMKAYEDAEKEAEQAFQDNVRQLTSSLKCMQNTCRRILNYDIYVDPDRVRKYVAHKQELYDNFHKR